MTSTRKRRAVSLLLVDDDPDYHLLIKRCLKDDEKYRYRVEQALSAEEAIAVCKATQFDCIIMDYRLPGTTGTETIGQLGEQLADDLPPTIVLTANGGETAAIDAIRAHAEDFLIKIDVNKDSLQRAAGNAVEKGWLRRDVKQRQIELAEANQELKRRNEEIQRFYHNASHEVKTPLTAIREFISIVHDGLAGAVTEDQMRLLNHALASCDQIRTQFDDLLELARFESGKIAVELQPVSLNEFLLGCMFAARPEAERKRLSVTTEINTGELKVNMDCSRIVQVVGNLVNNAIKFTPAGGSITVSCDPVADETEVQLSVQDTGRGISEADQLRIFERLYQVVSTSREEDDVGLGLGLNIASEIVERHGGQLVVSSTPGQGSTFSFCLPVVTDAASGDDVERAAA